jgi:hypothetical protein
MLYAISVYYKKIEQKEHLQQFCGAGVMHIQIAPKNAKNDPNRYKRGKFLTKNDQKHTFFALPILTLGGQQALALSKRPIGG